MISIRNEIAVFSVLHSKVTEMLRSIKEGIAKQDEDIATRPSSSDSSPPTTMATLEAFEFYRDELEEILTCLLNKLDDYSISGFLSDWVDQREIVVDNPPQSIQHHLSESNDHPVSVFWGKVAAEGILHPSIRYRPDLNLGRLVTEDTLAVPITFLI